MTPSLSFSYNCSFILESFILFYFNVYTVKGTNASLELSHRRSNFDPVSAVHVWYPPSGFTAPVSEARDRWVTAPRHDFLAVFMKHGTCLSPAPTGRLCTTPSHNGCLTANRNRTRLYEAAHL